MKMQISIPKERMKILKKNLNNFFKKIKEVYKDFQIEAEDNTILINGEDPIKVYQIYYIFLAFGRGFSIEDALLLKNEDYRLEIIYVDTYTKSRNKQIVLKGRVIGEKGKAKKLIEQYTNTKISIYGKTVSIIGKFENVEIAKRAVEMLLEGAKHQTVYRFLEQSINTML